MQPRQHVVEPAHQQNSAGVIWPPAWVTQILACKRPYITRSQRLDLLHFLTDLVKMCPKEAAEVLAGFQSDVRNMATHKPAVSREWCERLKMTLSEIRLPPDDIVKCFKKRAFRQARRTYTFTDDSGNKDAWIAHDVVIHTSANAPGQPARLLLPFSL